MPEPSPGHAQLHYVSAERLHTAMTPLPNGEYAGVIALAAQGQKTLAMVGPAWWLRQLAARLLNVADDLDVHNDTGVDKP